MPGGTPPELFVTPMDGEMAQLTTLALQGHLPSVVRPIALRRKATDGIAEWHFGSAQVVRIGERLILVTAAHNLADGDLTTKTWDLGLSDLADNWFDKKSTYWLDDQRLWTWANGALLLHSETGEQTQVGDREIDLAAVEVTPEEVERFGFTPINHTGFFPAGLGPGIYALLFGYPTELYDTSQIEAGRVRARFMCLATQGAPLEHWGEPWRQAIAQVLMYPEKDVDRWDGASARPDPLPHPGGISGSTIWTARHDGGLFSYKNLVFCGIQHTYNEANRTVRGNNAGAVVNLIANHWADAKPLFEALGFRVETGVFKSTP